jgi:probable HAF family extracellular repeat protein
VGVSGQHAFLYVSGAFTDLGTLSGGSSVAYAINDSNQIVGASDGHAFLYQNGVMTDLNSLIDPALGITLTQSRAIARIGYIVADASNGHSYLLTPPSTVPFWHPGVAYTVGQQVYFGGHIYQCVQAHTSQVTEEPPDVPALWRLIS